MWRGLHFVNDSHLMSSYIHHCCSHFADKVSLWYWRTPCLTLRRDATWMAWGNFSISKAPRERFVWWRLRWHGKRWWKWLYILFQFKFMHNSVFNVDTNITRGFLRTLFYTPSMSGWGWGELGLIYVLIRSYGWNHECLYITMHTGMWTYLNP